MKIIVGSRTDAVYLEPPEGPWAAISIKNPGMEQVRFPTERRVGLLRLDFDDLDRIPSDSRQFTLFSAEMAKEVWDFVESVWDKVDTIFIHCNHGMSRSPAIAAGIAKVKLGDDSEWFKTKVPNRRVFQLMLAIANQRGLI